MFKRVMILKTTNCHKLVLRVLIQNWKNMMNFNSLKIQTAALNLKINLNMEVSLLNIKMHDNYLVKFVT